MWERARAQARRSEKEAGQKAAEAASLARQESRKEAMRKQRALADKAEAEAELAAVEAELRSAQAEIVAVTATREAEPGPGPGLDTLEDLDVVLRICGFLGLKDLGRLACVSRCFGGRLPWPSRGAAVVGGAPPPRAWNVVEESARRWLLECPPEQRAWVPRRPDPEPGIGAGGPNRRADTWLSLRYEVEQLRAPLRLTRVHADLKLQSWGRGLTSSSRFWIEASEEIFLEQSMT